MDFFRISNDAANELQIMFNKRPPCCCTCNLLQSCGSVHAYSTPHWPPKFMAAMLHAAFATSALDGVWMGWTPNGMVNGFATDLHIAFP